MHPRLHASKSPEHPAYILPHLNETVIYGELESRANQCAHLFRSLGLKRGDHFAILLENSPRYFELVWAAQRTGLYFTCLPTRLKKDEVLYILNDCNAKVFFTSTAMKATADEVRTSVGSKIEMYCVDGVISGFRSLVEERSNFPATPISDESGGMDMLYSSGTTGHPKGIKRALPEASEPIDVETPQNISARMLFGLSEQTVYLSPAPLYHAAPLLASMNVHRYGGTVIVMEKFDAEHALELIDHYKVTASQWVPTHFVRMLKLPEETRARYDTSSMQIAIHAAAPCPIEVKEQMLDWWGEIIYEYYGGTEGIGTTFITPQEWLTHKGSVGRPIPPCTISICDEDGKPLPANTNGLIYFHGGAPLEYHNAPSKTAEAHNGSGAATMGDIGHLDEEGYLYLSDRKDFMVISGGVNIYPQEVENVLTLHPDIEDVAVFGIPCPNMGERLIAIIVPRDPEHADDELAQAIIAYAHERISPIKVPKLIEFSSELPRLSSGKLQKKKLRQDYTEKFLTLPSV